MLYSKSEFCKMAGISKETLRHYIDKDLIKPANISANGYRKFSDVDVLHLWEIRLGASLGHSLSRMKEKRNSSSLVDFYDELDIREKELCLQLEELQHQLDMVEEIKHYVHRELASRDVITIERSKTLYRCTYTGSTSSEKQMEIFVNAFPYTSFAIDYVIQSCGDTYTLKPELALYIVESRKSKLQIESYDELEYVPSMESICMTIVTGNPLSLTYKDFEPLFLEMRRKQLAPKSNIICSVFYGQRNRTTKAYLLRCRILV
ncbi:MAG: helix-turn-helix transcriptional regulator, MerR family [Anaerocolumna sp.]|jgi:DNA-binding transcriptional MerR regulator|nr:helix-turn-helix transcriptional regulator, MerR family [Anaerocolumna sp.]